MLRFHPHLTSRISALLIWNIRHWEYSFDFYFILKYYQSQLELIEQLLLSSRELHHIA